MPRIPLRPIRIQGSIACVPLTRGYEAVIDVDDVSLVEGCNWSARVTPRSVYAARADYSGPERRTIYLHRTLMGEPEGLEVDHRDGDGLNNRRANLREATRSQNQHNRRIRTDISSGFKGVYWNKRGQKWRAFIRINGKEKHLGYFTTPEEAHAAYCAASDKYHGEFGRTK